MTVFDKDVLTDVIVFGVGNLIGWPAVEGWIMKEACHYCHYNEMKTRFPDEWVLVGNLETDENLQVLAGEILWHTKDRDELYRKARELRPPESAILFFGQIPDEVAVIL